MLCILNVLGVVICLCTLHCALKTVTNSYCRLLVAIIGVYLQRVNIGHLRAGCAKVA